jgi:hypothetical protein
MLPPYSGGDGHVRTIDRQGRSDREAGDLMKVEQESSVSAEAGTEDRLSIWRETRPCVGFFGGVVVEASSYWPPVHDNRPPDRWASSPTPRQPRARVNIM